MSKAERKLYCYVDETGQDTEGRFFAVSILVTEPERDALFDQLEIIEKRSRKGSRKWKRTRPRAREKYVKELFYLNDLNEKVFFAIYRSSRQYLVHTADAIARVLSVRSGDRVIIYIDALNDVEKFQIKRQLRPSVKIAVQLRRIRREESNAFIRLVDAICGLVRDAEEGKPWAKQTVQKLKKKGILQEL